jgi:hypothetical protein
MPRRTCSTVDVKSFYSLIILALFKAESTPNHLNTREEPDLDAFKEEEGRVFFKDNDICAFMIF